MLGRHIAAGFIPLGEMPRVRDLRLNKDIAITRDGPQFRSGADMAEEGLRLVRVIPLFPKRPRRQ